MAGRFEDEGDRVIVYSDEEDEEASPTSTTTGTAKEGEEEDLGLKSVIVGFEPAEDNSMKDVLEDGQLWKVGVLKEGEGEFGVEPGMWVSCHYKGWIIKPKIRSDRVIMDMEDIVDCDLVELEMVEDMKLKFKLGTTDVGKRRVISALEYGLWGMKKGEKAVFIAHHDLGYGYAPHIPYQSNLKLEVEVLDFYDNLGMKEDFTDIIRHRIVAPEDQDVDLNESGKPTQPEKGALVKGEIVGEYEGRIFDERTTDWLVGLEQLYDLPPGFEVAIKSFIRGEKSRLVLKGDMGFGPKGFEKFGIPPDATVTYTVTLLEFMNTPQFSLKESVLYATKLIAAGKDAMDCKRISSALEHFSLALRTVERKTFFVKIIPAELDEKISHVRVFAATSIAVCRLTDLKKYSIEEAITLLEKICKEQYKYLQANIQKYAAILTSLTECYIADKNFAKGKTTLEKLKKLDINISDTEALTEKLNNEFAKFKALEAKCAKIMLELGKVKI